jgi:2-polyprenyl-3-methyl-5-hydroxy-6-metoxy-1,4-benzoquinol methylase
MSSKALTKEQANDRDQFVERLLKSTAGVFDIYTIYIGGQLGYYHELSKNGPVTASQLAARTNTNDRYVREWLEQQTISGVLEVSSENGNPSGRKFKLPPGRAEVLVDQDSLNYLAPLAQMTVGAARPVSSVVNAFRQGGGVPFGDYGADMREGQAAMNRAAFLQELGQEWLPAVPGVHSRLQSHTPAHIADIGCGAGWSAIGMAIAYPNAIVEGYDLDTPSIELARRNASEAGLGDRVSFYARDAAEAARAGGYDLVTALECVHDMSDPVKVLSTMRDLAGEVGTVIVMDQRVGEEFTPDGDEVEQMMYGWSVLHCLPVGMADQPSVGTGTVMRAKTLREYANQAGFSEVEVLPIDHYFFRFYRLII